MSPDTASPERRRFLARVVTTIHAAIGGTLAAILGGAVVSPSFARRRERWLGAGALTDLSENEPTAVTIRVVRDDGYAQIVERQVVFLVKTGDSEVTALSSTCTHLGCRVSWDTETAALKCPCHGGAFDRTGAATAGPPPTGLPRLAVKIEGERILVQV